jgi:hypothetical protein
MTPYPPQPWQLRASAWISIWRVPINLAKSLPGLDVSPFQVLGSAVLCSGFVDYQVPGDLTYRECFLAALTRAEGQWGVSLPLIWVDSQPALRGGVELWAIPKQFATFSFHAPHYRAELAELCIAELRLQKTGRWSMPFRAKGIIVQYRERAGVRTPLRILGKVRFVRAQWSIAKDSPLACLRNRRPWFSCAISNADMLVGA